MSKNGLDRSVQELVYRSCQLLNQNDYDGFMECCGESFRYKITAYSPELLKDMTWQDVDRKELYTHLKLIEKHVSDPALLTRHSAAGRISYREGDKQADVETPFQVYRTTLDGGETKLLAIGTYVDVVDIHDAEAPTLLSRNVRLDTRQLGVGSQIPF